MIIYENTVEGRFVRRLNRFVAEVAIGPAGSPNGQDAPSGVSAEAIERVHVKNTGRLAELLVPGAKVTLQDAATNAPAHVSELTRNVPARKTRYDLISVFRPGLGWINIDSLVPNALVKEYLLSQDYDIVRPEHTYGNSRFDFYMERGGERCLVEVKGCTLAADREGNILYGPIAATEESSDASIATDGLVGLFPDAPTERGVKHLHELASAAKDGYRCQIVFVIQMNGIRKVLPNDRTQPEFGQALREAQEAGVEVRFLGCRVESDRISLDV